MRETVLDERRGAGEALVRALHASAAHFVEPGAAEESADILARPEYLDAPRDAVLRAITDFILPLAGGEPIHYPHLMFQYHDSATFPSRSPAAWPYRYSKRRLGKVCISTCRSPRSPLP